jgi:hypothetical protein
MVTSYALISLSVLYLDKNCCKTTEPALTVGQNAQLKLANFATAKVIINRQ